MIIFKKLRLFILLILVSTPFGFAHSDSSSLLGDCAYYRSFNEELGCKNSSYMIQFGEHYCYQFDQARHRFTQQGNFALDQIKLCLQELLQYNPELTCQNAKQIGADSHIECYQQAQFCKLPTKDKFILAQIIAPSLSDPILFRSIQFILWSCL